jgi:DNA mismatch repair ATPase MutS
MSFFDHVQTCFPSSENQKLGLSRFMAAKKDMDETTRFIDATNGKKILLLVDEPFSGTVESDKAARTYDFGISIKDKPKLMCVLATHVYQPTLLEEETNGIFKNYQPEIIKVSAGNFTNTFKIKPGPATWWFTKEGDVAEYNDWLSTRIRS